MRKKAKGVLKPLLAPPGPLCNAFQLTKISGKKSDDLIGIPVVEGTNHNGIRREERHKRTRSNPNIEILVGEGLGVRGEG